jgi:DNA-binding transcriptional regulator YhcF (GntR family)/DNA-binding LacI/PurR family transcriptional regulator
MNIKPSPATEKVVTYLRTILDNKGATHIPPVRKLAQLCGVSLVTANKGIAQLRSEGAIISRWGHGNFSPSHVPLTFDKEKSEDDCYESKFTSIVNSIKKDLSSGLYPPNEPMPQIKHLVNIYGVSYPTIRNVLNQLIKENVLVRNGNKFLFKTIRSKLRLKIAIIAFGIDYNAVKIATERERNFYRQLSIAAAGHDVDLEIICYNDYLDTPKFFVPENQNLKAYLQKDIFCGIILSSYHMKNSADCLRHLSLLKKPVSVWIEDHSVLALVNKYSNKENITFFDASYSTQPGFETAKFLYEKGHRSIAFISPFHASSWSKNRLQGINSFFKTINEPYAIHEFVRDEFISDYSFMENIIESGQINKFLITEKLHNTLNDALHHRIVDIKLDVNSLLRDNLIYNYSNSLFEKALNQQGISAWVAVNDLTACLIYDFWDLKKIPLKMRPALISFDNTFESLEKGISSYDFNTSGDVNNMILHLLYPNSALFSSKKRVIRIKGTVVQRKSSEYQL